MIGAVHVMPRIDLVEHTRSQNCVCGPRVEVELDADTLVVHHSLDGRELTEERP